MEGFCCPSGAALPLLRCLNNCLNVKTIFGGQPLTDPPNLVDNRVFNHTLFSHELFRRADNWAVEQMLSADQSERSGIRDNLVRISTGIEAIEDIVADLDQALSR